MAANVEHVEKFVSWKNLFKVFFGVLFSLILFSKCQAESQGHVDDDDITFESLYEAGKDAYYEERWAQCASFILRSLEDFSFYKRNLAHCRLSCKSKSSLLIDKKRKSIGENLDNLFLYGAVQNSDCVRRCKKKLFGKRPLVTKRETVDEFESLEPYNYLQLCLFKLENMKDAVAAAYTFYMGNLDHEIMLKNLQQYRRIEGITEADFIDLEQPTHIALYLRGSKAYEKNDWFDVIELMERSVNSFYTSHRECSALCEDPFKQESQDFYNNIADHYINILKCKERCSTKVSTMFGKYTANVLQEHYHYLQYAYFQVGDIKSAAQCVGTYLLFKPKDDTMMINKRLYSALGMGPENFKPRDDALGYHSQRSYEAEIINFVQGGHYKTGILDDDDGIPSEIKLKPPPNDDRIMDIGRMYVGDGNGNGARYKNGNGFEVFMNYLTNDKKVTVTERLDDHDRLMGESLLNKEECGELMNAAMIGGFPREGVREQQRNKPYPDSLPREAIQFLKADRVGELVKLGKLKKKAVQLFLNTAELMQDIAVNYFNLTDYKLYLRDLRMLCRKIYNSRPDDMTKLEEACILQEDGLCLSDGSWKDVDYHAVVYMNEPKDGGLVDYFLPGSNVKKVVNPSCGKFVLLSPKKNVHNVHSIDAGTRCAVSLALTHNKDLQDLSVLRARNLLREYEYLENTPKDTLYSEGMMEFYKNHGISVSLEPKDLNGIERFAADGLASDEQCEMLIKLAKKAAKPHDGYETDDDSSPAGVVHTENETFMGLTLTIAAESHSTTGDGYHQGNLGTIQHTGLKESPHTKHETFQGLTVDRAAKLAEQNLVDVDAVRQYLNLSELAKEVTQNYFKLDTPLYFDFTHLVCRTAVNAENKNRTDLSHPVHSDNCLLQKDGTCRKELPAYIQRDYSALLYLNGDFEGGEFIFTDKKLNIEAMVKPKCGRVVGFNAGEFHGVKAVLKGQRCAIAMWYTLDPFYKEAAHTLARDALKKIKTTDSQRHDHGGEL